MIPEDEFYNQIMIQADDNHHVPNIQRQQQQRQKAVRAFTNVKILMKDDSELTERIINFFDRKLSQLNMKGFKFEWTIVTAEEEEYYEDEDITKFPTLLVNDENISGVSSIIKALKNMIKFGANTTDSDQQLRQQRQQPQSDRPKMSNGSTDPNQSVRDYFLDNIKKDDKNDDDDEDLDEGSKFATDMSKRISDMQEQRKQCGMLEVASFNGSKSNVTQRSGPIKPKNRDYKVSTDFSVNKPVSTNVVDILKFNKKNKGADNEDAMLQKFYENQEETEI